MVDGVCVRMACVWVQIGGRQNQSHPLIHRAVHTASPRQALAASLVILACERRGARHPGFGTYTVARNHTKKPPIYIRVGGGGVLWVGRSGFQELCASYIIV